MGLAVAPPLVLAAGIKHMAVHRPFREGLVMAGLDLRGDDVETDAADA